MCVANNDFVVGLTVPVLAQAEQKQTPPKQTQKQTPKPKGQPTGEADDGGEVVRG